MSEVEKMSKKDEISKYYWGYRLRDWLKQNKLKENHINNLIVDNKNEELEDVLFRLLDCYEELKRYKQLQKDFKAEYYENPIMAKKYQEQKIKYYTEKQNFYEKYFFELYKAV